MVSCLQDPELWCNGSWLRQFFISDYDVKMKKGLHLFSFNFLMPDV